MKGFSINGSHPLFLIERLVPLDNFTLTSKAYVRELSSIVLGAGSLW